MTEPLRPSVVEAAEEEVELTRTLEALDSSKFADPEAPVQPFSALLVCRDADARKWGLRWLGQAGLDTQLVTESGKERAAIVLKATTDVVVIDASIADTDGRPLYKMLSAAGELSPRVIVLCASPKEYRAAVESGAYDVIRKPFEWQVISRRARYAAESNAAELELYDARKKLEEALKLANIARRRLRSRESFEPVTGMPNRKKFVTLLDQCMNAVLRDDNELAVIVVGFTRFRLVVEAMGQENAERVISEIGNSLLELVGQATALQENVSGLRTAVVGSLDQFRFAAMLTCNSKEDAFVEFQQRLIETLSQPVNIAGQTVYLSACLGIALFPQDAEDANSLLQRSDNAMREAQARGGGVHYFCAETDAEAVYKLKLEHLIHEALDNQKLHIAYQPILSADKKKIPAVEALIRWPDDEETIHPSEFIPIAEESGLITRLGEYVLDEACRQLTEWRSNGLNLKRICVNVARAQLTHERFPQFVSDTLQKHHLSPDSLELELSERGVLSGDYNIIASLMALKELGVQLSVDDFGTGDSAIAYLKDLPVDTLKIDKSYVENVVDDPKVDAMTSAIVILAQKLDLRVIAEGVEKPEQLKRLQEMGCDEVQGFLLARPMPPAALLKMLKSQ